VHFRGLGICNPTLTSPQQYNFSKELLPGTDPENTRGGGWPRSSVHVLVIIRYSLPYTKWCKTVTTDGMAMMVGLTGRK